MKHMKLYLFVVVLCLLTAKGIGLAETRYVSDRLYLSLRSSPESEQPALELLSSDTRVDVLQTEGKWAHVRLEDGRTGWVWKRFLVKDVPKSLVIEQLRRQIEDKDVIAEGLREEIVLRDTEIKALKSQISQQSERFELAIKGNSSKRLRVLYATSIVTFFIGLILGYLVRRVRKPDLGFLPTEEIRKRLLGSQ